MKVVYKGQQAKYVHGINLHVGMVEDMPEAMAQKLKETLGDEIEISAPAAKKAEPIKPEKPAKKSEEK